MSLLRTCRPVASLALVLLWPAAAFAQAALPPAPRDTPPIAEKTVSLEVSRGDLRAVIAMLGRQAAVRVLVCGGDQPYKPVYVHLDGASLSKALQAIALCAGAQVTRNGDGVYVFSPLSTSPPLPGAVPEIPAVGYRWHTLVLQHAVPSDILALMHWNKAALPPGVLRIFALQSSNSLLVEATEEGFATVAKIVKTVDIAPRSVQFHMELVAVPESRARLYAPDMPASQLLPLLLAGESRAASIPAETVMNGQTTSFFVDSPVSPAPASSFRLTQVGPMPDGYDLSTHRQFRLTPRINADDTITLVLAFATTAPLSSMQAGTPRTLRAGALVVYDVTGLIQINGERLFLFLSPIIISESGATHDDGDSVTVTP